MRNPFALVFTFVLSVLPLAAWAQSGWQAMQPQYGNGAASCIQDGNGFRCLSLQCHPERGVEFGYFTNSAGTSDPGLSVARTDDGTTEMLRWRDVGAGPMRIQNLDIYGMGDFLLSLAKAQHVTVTDARATRFDVRGADLIIDQVLASCQNVEFSSYPENLVAMEALLEKERGWSRRPEDTELTYLYQTDSWGNDLAELRGLDRNGCIEQCLGRADCKLTTYNDTKGVCFLKSDFGTLRRTSDAFTTYVSKRPTVVRAPALPGPAPVQSESLRASPLVNWQDSVAALRNASSTMGGNCNDELAAVQRMAQSLEVYALPSQGVAGETVSFRWTNEALTQRVPAWIVLSADRPVRFDGTDFFALNSGAVGPFGIGVDATRQRAIAPLYTRDTLTGAEIRIKPLEAGPYELKATLVTYLRACQQEVPLVQTAWEMEVAPAAPHIVLRDISEAYPFDRRIEVPEWGRRVELNDNRFTIQYLSDGSEVISREGAKVRLSPTKRFLVIENNAGFEIVDIVDGASLLIVPGSQDFAFWNADSFFLTDRAPWGEVSMGATLKPEILHESVRTGGSCCMNSGTTSLFVDLENNLAVVQGVAVSLLDSDRGLGEFHVTPYANKPLATGRTPTTLSKSFRPRALATEDYVAAVYSGQEWSLPLGPFFVHGYNIDYGRSAEDPEDMMILTMALADDVDHPPNPDFGKSFVALKTAPANMALRGASRIGGARHGFVEAMTRVGVTLKLGDIPTAYLDIDRGGVEANDLTAQEIAQFQNAKLALENDLRARGKGVDWAVLQKEEDQIGHFCEHWPNADETRLKSPSELDLAYRFDRRGDAIWVTRATCLGGTLGSNLVAFSALNIFDASQPMQWHGEFRVDSHGTYGSSFYNRAIFETDFETKLFHDRYVVTYAPGEGAIQVFDLTTRDFLMQLRYARRGDLLENVFIDAEARHLYQLNSNGSFSVYRLSDGAAILEGRYLDDEVVIWTATFHFDSTEEGATFVELRFPGQPGQYSFQQFQNAQRIPGLMARVLDGSISLSNIDVGIPPRIEGWLKPKGPSITGMIMVEADTDLRSVRVFQDGVQTDDISAAPGRLVEIEALRLPGTRWVSVVAEDDNGLVSLPLNVDLGEAAQDKPRVHLFGVGVDYYETDALASLNFAKRDVRTLSETMTARDGVSSELASTTLLGDRRATADTILTKLEEVVSTAAPGDRLVLFFAGHGLRDDKGRFFFGLSNTDLDALDETALGWDRVAGLLQRRDIRVTVLLDACHAGAAGTGAFATNDEAVGALIDKTSANVTVIAAAKGRQYSGESSDVGGGYFTAAIRDVVLDENQLYDENGNGVLEAVEFYRGVKSFVTTRRGNAQTPWMVRNQLVGDYALF